MKVGDLVRYKERENGVATWRATYFGIVTYCDGYHAEVHWIQDSYVYYEDIAWLEVICE